MKTRAQVLAERKAAPKPMPIRQPGLTPLALAELATFLERTGCSLHLRRQSDGRFVAVAHLAREERASVSEAVDLEHALRTVLADF